MHRQPIVMKGSGKERSRGGADEGRRTSEAVEQPEKKERRCDKGRFPKPPPSPPSALSSLILTPVLSSPWKARDDAAPSSPREQASGLLHNIYVRHKHAPVLTHVRFKKKKTTTNKQINKNKKPSPFHHVDLLPFPPLWSHTQGRPSQLMLLQRRQEEWGGKRCLRRPSGCWCNWKRGCDFHKQTEGFWKDFRHKPGIHFPFVFSNITTKAHDNCAGSAN